MIPEAFAPRTEPDGEHFVLRQRRSWAPWALGLLSGIAGLMGVALLIEVPAGALLFLPLAAALGWAGVRFYSDEVVAIEVVRGEGKLRWQDVAIPLDELEAVEVLGNEQPQLLIRYGQGRSTIVPARAHEVEDARKLAEVLSG